MTTEEQSSNSIPPEPSTDFDGPRGVSRRTETDASEADSSSALPEVTRRSTLKQAGLLAVGGLGLRTASSPVSGESSRVTSQFSSHSTFETKTWQSDHRRIREQPIEELCFPGTHHAPMYDADAADWWFTQSRDVYTQLSDGIRYLDIRVEADTDELGNIEFYGHHGGAPNSGANADLLAKTGAPFLDVFEDLRAFLDELASEGANELVLIKLSHFWDSRSGESDEFEQKHWDALTATLRVWLGGYLLDRSKRGTWSDMIANTSLSDFSMPRVAVFFRGGQKPDFAWEMPDRSTDWLGYSPNTVRPSALFTGAMEQDLGALGWAVTADGSKLAEEGVDEFEDVFLPDGYEDEYDNLREAAWKLNQLLGGIVPPIKADPDKSPRVLLVDYYETSNVVGHARDLSLLGVNNGMPGSAPFVEERVYSIRSQDSGDVVEIEDGWGADPEAESADVAEEEYSGDDTQTFRLSFNEDHTCRFTNLRSYKVLQGNGNGDQDGRDVRQYSWDQHENQRWYPIPLPDGNYCFLNKHTTKVLDGANPGDNVHQWEWHGGDNQRWALEPRLDTSPGPIQPGLYQIRWSSNAVTVRDSSTAEGANVQIETASDEPGQLFAFVPLSDDTYKIVNVYSGHVLDGYQLQHGTDVHQWDWHGGDNQRWYVEDIGGDEVALVNKASDLVLDAAGAWPGSNVRQSGWANSLWSNWEIRQPESSYIFESECRLESVASGLLADVRYGSTDNGANVWLWGSNGSDAQVFDATRLDDGTYRFVNANSGKVLDGYWPSDGDNVHQWEGHGGDNQRWYVYDVGNGKYSLVNKLSGRLLEAGGSDFKDNVRQGRWHGGDTQRWRIMLA